MQGLLIKQRADKKAGDMKSMYAQIDKQEKWHKTTKWLKGLFSGAVGFMGFVVYLGIIGAVLVGGYFAWQTYGGKITESAGLNAKPAASSGQSPPSTVSEPPK